MFHFVYGDKHFAFCMSFCDQHPIKFIYFIFLFYIIYIILISQLYSFNNQYHSYSNLGSQSISFELVIEQTRFKLQKA